VLLRVLPLLVLFVFVDPDSKICEFISDLDPSVVSMRYKRSFSEAMKIANFSFSKGSGWVCASTCYISVIACSNREASFFARYIFVSSSICIPLSICLTESVRAMNLSDCFNGDVYFRFLTMSDTASLPIWLIG
jgi:hypothetical protein